MDHILRQIRAVEEEIAETPGAELTREAINNALAANRTASHDFIMHAAKVSEAEKERITLIGALVRDSEFDDKITEGVITFGMIKPYANTAHPDNKHLSDEEIARRVVNAINSPLQIAVRGNTLIPREETEQFYGHLASIGDGSIFKRVVRDISGGAVTGLILSDKENKQAVQEWRRQIGATKPEAAEPGTIRHTFATSIENNVVHGSDGVESVRGEIQAFVRWLKASIR